MTELTRFQKRAADKNLKTKKSVCKFLTRPSQLIKDRTGSGNDYTDTYYFCSNPELKKRITKKHCKDCKLYEAFKYEN